MNFAHIIPRPLKMELTAGTFTLRPETRILVSENTRAVGEYLTQRLAPATGFPFNIEEMESVDRQTDAIALQIAPTLKELGEEGYKLSITADGILLTAATPAGVFYACQTLLQLLPPAINSRHNVTGVTWTLPQTEIQDKPRFPWRGILLDVGRHFMPTEFIKTFIDLLARYKMNVFHWHLTEDQGWRIEIEQYPKLTEIGAWRTENGKPYGGYYTRAEVEEIVEYAQQRFVTVVPEIELPGHALAALAAYPEFSCTGGPFRIEEDEGIFKDVYCAGNEHTFEFLENILTEVIGLFPSPYIHIGGDECPKDRWKTCPKCQTRIKAEGLNNEEELQSYVIKRIERFLNAHDKKLIGWDEILEGGLAPDATVMSWRGMEGGIKAAKQGHDVIMTPTSHCYFDYYQSEQYELEPRAHRGYLPLETVYDFEPIPDGFTPEQAKHILGSQGNIWAEYISTPQQVQYMNFPRMCALAEVVWSDKSQRNLDDFLARLSKHYARFDILGVNYRHHQKA